MIISGDDVYVRRYRITVELLDEPVEDIQQRIIGLWERTSSAREGDALKLEAARYGFTLDLATRGSRYTRKP